jgi:hypothetical protein
MAAERYKFFIETIYDSINVLKKKFNYKIIDANGTIVEVCENIAKELRYQR